MGTCTEMIPAFSLLSQQVSRRRAYLVEGLVGIRGRGPPGQGHCRGSRPVGQRRLPGPRPGVGAAACGIERIDGARVKTQVKPMARHKTNLLATLSVMQVFLGLAARGAVQSKLDLLGDPLPEGAVAAVARCAPAAFRRLGGGDFARWEDGGRGKHPRLLPRFLRRTVGCGHRAADRHVGRGQPKHSRAGLGAGRSEACREPRRALRDLCGRRGQASRHAAPAKRRLGIARGISQ